MFRRHFAATDELLDVARNVILIAVLIAAYLTK